MSNLSSLDAPSLERFLLRWRASARLAPEVDLGFQLREILGRARELVPSESGSILLDDPVSKSADYERNDLCFIAAFGPAGQQVLGARIPATEGVAGRVYRTGVPHLSSSTTADVFFSPTTDARTGYHTESILAVPVRIGASVCGVLELVNRLDGEPFSERDLRLLEIFSGYTSWTLQNALDAKRAHELARKDDLTGLYNDRWLHARLPDLLVQADEHARPCSLIFMDLDHFKQVNDRFGHQAGSQVLREIGFLLSRVVDMPDALCARYGGDEFAVLLQSADVDAAIAAAERIRAAIQNATFVSHDYDENRPALNLRGVISASIGVAEYKPGSGPGDPESRKSALIHRADAAMYAAKAGGKNRVIVAEPG